MQISQESVVSKMVLSHEKQHERDQIKQLIAQEGLEVFDLTIDQEDDIQEYANRKRSERPGATGDGIGAFAIILSFVTTSCVAAIACIAIESGKPA